MAKTTPHTELGRYGFKLVGEGNNGSGGRTGEVNVKHYAKLRNTIGGGITRPIVHHVMVSEYAANPGKYDVTYSISQDGVPYADGRYDWTSRHESNYHGGSKDPLDVILRHHDAVNFSLDKERSAPSPLVDIDEKNVHRLTPGSFHATPMDDDIEKQRRIVRGPRYDMTYLNSAQDEPLDPRVHRALTGKLGFEYQGRLDPEDNDTDVYHVSHEDPEDPYMRYGFTIRHRPGAEATSVQGTKKKGQPDLLEKPLAFSYNATHYPIDMGDDRPVGDFMRVSDDGSPVASFTALGPVIERHHNLLRTVGLMRNIKPARRPDWHYQAAVEKKCPECGDTDVDFIMNYAQDDKGLNSIPTGKKTGQCNNCYSEFEPREIMSEDAAEWSPRHGSGPVSNEDWDSFVAGRNPAQGMMPDGTPVVHHFDPDFGRMEEPDSRGARSMTYLPHAVERGASGNPEVYEPRGRCVTCGRPTWNNRDGGQAPEWESTGNAHEASDYGMHGPDVPQCANCANEYDTYKEAIRAGQRPGGLWHHPGARINTCDRCADDLMNEADEDLR